MRISSSLFFQTGLNSINAQQADLLHLYRQAASGQRMVTPADDPLAAAQAVNLSQSQSLNERYGANRDVLKMNLGNEENTLNSVTILLQDIKTRLVEAGNGTMSDADRATLADVLRNSKDTLFGLANATDGNGQYMFSGFAGSQPAFAKDASGAVSYAGDSGQRLIQADQTRRIHAGDLGSDVFSRAASGSRAYITHGDPGNSGTGVIGAPAITDPQGANVGKPFSIEFADNGGVLQYTVRAFNADGSEAQVDGPHDYNPDTVTLALPGGLQVAFSGQPSANDKFTIEPASTPAYVARGAAGNTGDGVVGQPVINDPKGEHVGKPFRIEFTDNGGTLQYTLHALDGAGNPVATDGPHDYVAGTTEFMLPGGVQVPFSGTPQVGDEFMVEPGSGMAADLNVFDTLDAIIHALDTPVSGDPASQARLANALASAMQKIDVNYDQVLTVRASVGSRLAEIDAIDASGNSRSLSYANQLSKLEDVDYYTVTTQLELRRSALEAAALAFKKIQGTSLFNMGS
ncbi:flagellar hook-associated protein FlgL [Pusillimonas sp.]|uniref:flagellar hook-associated protein FlgL n=1 Tax=Pusillimonas sp. TaxID=3040095 RepID=UPI0037CCB0FD